MSENQQNNRIGYIISDIKRKQPSINTAEFLVDTNDKIEMGELVAIEMGAYIILAEIEDLWYYNTKYPDAAAFPLLQPPDNIHKILNLGYREESYLAGRLNLIKNWKEDHTPKTKPVAFPPKPGSTVLKLSKEDKQKYQQME